MYQEFFNEDIEAKKDGDVLLYVELGIWAGGTFSKVLGDPTIEQKEMVDFVHELNACVERRREGLMRSVVPSDD